MLYHLGRYARSLRVVVGADLVLRFWTSGNVKPQAPPLGPDGKPMRSQVFAQNYPYAVPLEDAEQNIRSIAKSAEEKGAKVLLVVQHIAKNSFNNLDEYWTMEQRLAAEYKNMYFIDPRPSLNGYPDSVLLVDNNHMSKKGHLELSKALENKIGHLLSK